MLRDTPVVMAAAGPAANPREARSAALSLGVLAGIAGFHVARAAVATEAAFDRHIGTPHAISKVEFSLLVLLMANDPLAPKRLARALAVTAPKLSLLLDRLEQRGLIKRQPNPQDGRSQHVLLTAKGAKLARDAAAAAQPMELALQHGLSPAEHAMLIELLGKLAGQSATTQNFNTRPSIG